MTTDIHNVKQIVAEQTGRTPIFLKDKAHAEHRQSKQACCWGGEIKSNSYLIACCQPSPQSKGDPLFAFFTFEKEATK